jgi:hypothetical protein
VPIDALGKAAEVRIIQELGNAYLQRLGSELQDGRAGFDNCAFSQAEGKDAENQASDDVRDAAAEHCCFRWFWRLARH